MVWKPCGPILWSQYQWDGPPAISLDCASSFEPASCDTSRATGLRLGFS